MFVITKVTGYQKIHLKYNLGFLKNIKPIGKGNLFLHPILSVCLIMPS
jgi:hypothetical protein